MRSNVLITLIALSLLTCFLTSHLDAQLATGWKAHDLKRPAPTVVTPSEDVGGAPSDAIVLFDGTDMSSWRSNNGEDAKWKVVDGAMESVPGSGFVYSREEFGDCQIHLEFAAPAKVKGNGQGRGNSGVFLMGEFEVQVLDSFDNSTYSDGGAGSIYGQYPPLVNACRKPGEWQSFDIIFRRPRFSDGELQKPAEVTVLQNGVVIQDASKPFGPTSWIQHLNYEGIKKKSKGPLSLQDHGNPVRYRNIWIRNLVEAAPQPETPYDPAKTNLAADAAEKLVGKYGAYEVKLNDSGNLVFVFNGQAQLEMIAHSETEFGFTKTAGSVKFEVDENGVGKSVKLQLDAAGTKEGERKSD